MKVRIFNKILNDSRSYGFEGKTTLAEVRSKLKTDNFMTDELYFLDDDAIVPRTEENTLTVADIISATNLYIGRFGNIPGGAEYTDFGGFSNSVILGFFKEKELFRGYRFDPQKGMTKSYVDLFTMNNAPQISTDTQNTYSYSAYSFSEVSQSMSIVTSNKASLALNTPYVNASAEYESVKKSMQAAKAVTEYLMSKFVVSYKSFKIDPRSIIPGADFAASVKTVMQADNDDNVKLGQLMKVLDQFGYYLPLEFTMGGALYSTETTQITEWASAQSESAAFTASADASFAGYGFSAGYAGGFEQSSTAAEKGKYQQIEIKQIGGTPGNTANKDIFKDSLTKINTWAIVDIVQFYPSVATLVQASKTLFAEVVGLLRDYSAYTFVKKAQPCLDMELYINRIVKMYGIR